VDTVLVQVHVEGLEFIVGAFDDSDFDLLMKAVPCGRLVELFGEFAYRALSANELIIREMATEAVLCETLDGFRVADPGDGEAHVEMLAVVSFSHKMFDFAELKFRFVVDTTDGIFELNYIII